MSTFYFPVKNVVLKCCLLSPAATCYIYDVAVRPTWLKSCSLQLSLRSTKDMHIIQVLFPNVCGKLRNILESVKICFLKK